MLALLVCGAIVVAGAIALWLTRDRFARGLAVMLVLMAGTLASVAIPLLLRDPKLRAGLAERIEAGAGDAAIAEETARMTKVMANYPIYRYGYVGMMIAAGVLALATRSGLAKGVATGLLLFAAAGLVVDHYSEERATKYLGALGR